MKLVKENINELFQKDSDPIKDMNIGGIEPYTQWKIISESYREAWIKFADEFKNKKIKGLFHKEKFREPKKEYTFIVKRIYLEFKKNEFNNMYEELSISSAIRFVDENGINYYTSGKDKIFILE